MMKMVIVMMMMCHVTLLRFRNRKPCSVVAIFQLLFYFDVNVSDHDMFYIIYYQDTHFVNISFVKCSFAYTILFIRTAL